MSLILIAQAEPPQVEPAPILDAETAPAEPPQAEPAPIPETESAPEESPQAEPAPIQVEPAEPDPALYSPPFPPETRSPPPEQLTAGAVIPAAPPRDMSITSMFLNADPVVQMVMLLLLLASVATWVVIFEKFLILRRASRQIMLFKREAAGRPGGKRMEIEDFPELAGPIALAGIKESRDAAGRETRSDFRERVERAMRAELAGLMDRLGCRVMFLASVGAVSPFVGLFGTVWGIMHSFIGIAASGETTLAVVAPGIAEALFATAMGLVAAIPAVVAYNKVTGTLKKITKEALAAIGLVGNSLAREHFAGGD